MKYVLNNLLKCLFAVSFVFAAVSCGDDGPKKIVIKNKNGDKITSYQEACTMHDFETAHRFIAKMPESGYHSWDVSSAKEHVFREEALFLIAQGDEASKKRIMFLLKQDPERNDAYLNILVELAISQDDEDFVKTLTRQYNSEIPYSVLRKIVEYLYIDGSDKNLGFVTTLLNRYNQTGALLDAAIEKDNEQLVLTLAKQFKGDLSYTTFENVMNFIKLKNNSEYLPIFNQLSPYVDDDKMLEFVNKDGIFSDKIVISYISKKLSKIYVRTPPGLGEVEVDKNSSQLPRDYGSYVEEVENYNRVCKELLGIVIRSKRKSAANYIVSSMKPSISKEKLYEWTSSIDYKLKYDYSDIEDAKKQVQAAF
jgi:mannitol/fructose-specific phosphotransferase system IIA component (Ntr-type)